MFRGSHRKDKQWATTYGCDFVEKCGISDKKIKHSDERCVFALSFRPLALLPSFPTDTRLRRTTSSWENQSNFHPHLSTYYIPYFYTCVLECCRVELWDFQPCHVLTILQKFRNDMQSTYRSKVHGPPARKKTWEKLKWSDFDFLRVSLV